MKKMKLLSNRSKNLKAKDSIEEGSNKIKKIIKIEIEQNRIGPSTVLR